MIERRAVILGMGATPLLGPFAMAAGAKALGGKTLGGKTLGGKALAEAMAELERASGGRLGVAVLDTGSGRAFGQHADDRFPMCSTFKFVLAAAVLGQVDRGLETLDRRVAIKTSDLLGNSPFTEKHVGPAGATVGQLCEAALIFSDNAAANLLLPIVGGPAGLTRYLRGLGDGVTRLDRREPELNTAIEGDPRDTTSPGAMLQTMRRLLLGPALGPASRARLIAWIKDNRTGGPRLRAGLPAGWSVGDKTGSGRSGTVNDIAIVWPPARAPVLITVYLTGSSLDGDGANAVHARAARTIAKALQV